MSRITIDELRIAASSAHQKDLSERERADLERRNANRIALESASAASALFFVSRMESLIDGFPADIDMTCSNGHLKGVFIRRREGKWVVDCPNPGLTRFSASDTTVIESAMRAMSIEYSPAAVQAIRSRVGWNIGTLAEDLVSAAEGLHRHTVVGLFGVGYDVGLMFGFSNREEVAVAFAKAAVALDVNLGETTVPGKMDVCTRLTNTIDLPFLKAMIEVGGAKPGVKALFSAVFAANVEGVEAILGTGISPASVGPDGETALHVAAHTAVNEKMSSGGIRMATRLVELGVPLDVKDGSGATARDILKDGIGRIHAGDLDDDNFDMDDLVSLETLLLGPQQRSELRAGI
ncbi:hypothetical protein OIU34_20235 [Pararhizobium sp. BT-229]|uniref:hypothetical protein n=1 Tax=Pararhizobium sp. BT-229 TaxID=2986923 RepID=UPI0021F6D166|nr:hypothetical protein [Pararhizobium sp. BT-229]MCV9964217.1 hypothetical protein [Pararhizobium sp. BT-229]